MKKNFTIIGRASLKQQNQELDLHNNHVFIGFDYSIAKRELVLSWKEVVNDRMCLGQTQNPRLSIKFKDVSMFRFLPRDPTKPFTEDHCVECFGYWADEAWSTDIILLDANQSPEPHWLNAISFMSGAILIFQADSAEAYINQ